VPSGPGNASLSARQCQREAARASGRDSGWQWHLRIVPTGDHWHAGSSGSPRVALSTARASLSVRGTPLGMVTGTDIDGACQ
jgi:hypothetical protein